MGVSQKYSQTRANECKQRKHDFSNSTYLEINIRDWWTLPLLTWVYLPPAGRMDFLELLQWWRVILLPRAWEQYSLEAWSIWVEQQMLGKEDEQPNDLCGWATWVCGAMALSLFPSSFLSLLFSPFVFFFSFLFLRSLSLSLSFKQDRADTFLKQGYSFGWLELEAWRYAISPTLGLCVTAKCAMSGSPFECIPLQRASKCSVDAVLMFSGIVCPLKWLGPRIPEGAYYA